MDENAGQHRLWRLRGKWQRDSGELSTGEPCNFSVQKYLDDEPPITAGREIWGFPKKYGMPRLKVTKDTLTGTLHYDGERVAMGTMAYKHVTLDASEVAKGLGKLNVNLKLLPDVDGRPKSRSSLAIGSRTSMFPAPGTVRRGCI